MEIDLETRATDRGSLALSLSTAVHLVIPIGFLASNHVVLVIAILLSLGITQIHSKCKLKPTSSALWQNQLLWCGLTALVCRGLTESLCEVDVLRVCKRLGSLSLPIGSAVTCMAVVGLCAVDVLRVCKRLGSLSLPIGSAVTCMAVVGLCALGLERSSIIRSLLTVSVAASTLFVFATSDPTSMFTELPENPTNQPQNSTEIPTTEVPHTTVLMLGGFFPTPSAPGEANLLTKPISCIERMIAALIYIFVGMAFHHLHVKRYYPTEKLKPGSLVLGLMPSDWHMLTATILQTTCLGLTLPDLVLGAAACSLRLCGRVIPRWLARETSYTGTHVAAFGFSGLISTILASLLPVRHLLEVVCLAYISSDALDALQALYARFQPSYYHQKEIGKAGETARYEMLATSEGSAIMQEEKDEESDDSGHSSDTDIDAAVAEFRVRVMVVENISKPVPVEPTPESGKKSFICLTLAVLMTLISGIFLRNSFAVLAVIPILVGIGLLLALAMLPTVPDVSDESGNFLVSFCLLLDCLLISQVSLEIIIIGGFWHIIGQLLSLKYGSRRFHHMAQRLKLLTTTKSRPANHRDSLHILQ